MLVGGDDHPHLPGRIHRALQVDRDITGGDMGPNSRALKCAGEIFNRLGPHHHLAVQGLDEQWRPNLGRRCEPVVVHRHLTGVRDERDPQPPSDCEQARPIDDLGQHGSGGADHGQVCGAGGLIEAEVLREEAIAGVHCVATRIERRRDDPLGVHIRLGDRATIQVHGVVAVVQVGLIGVSFGEDHGRLDVALGVVADQAPGDLAAVGHQHPAKAVCGIQNGVPSGRPTVARPAKDILMKIGIIGPGRLGRSLAVLLDAAGRTAQLIGRGQSIPSVDVVLLTVPDRAIAGVAASIPTGQVVLHCSGACEVEILRPHRPAGSLHPLMTFPGPEIALPDLNGVPAAVAGDPRAVEVARQLAADLGMRAFEVHGDRRLYHAAAVMAGNFSTVLLAEAARVLAAAGVDPAEASALLAPLALQSLQNARSHPVRSLTGPVARGDEAVMSGHREALIEAGLPDLEDLYERLTEHARRLIAAQVEKGNDR